MKANLIERHRAVQNIAKSVLDSLAETIDVDDTERTIASRAIKMLADRGITETWYHQCPALVLLGSRSCLSISGRNYLPAGEAVGRDNVITIDLSPVLHGVWGDCARTIFVEGGAATKTPSRADYRSGAQVLAELHASILAFAKPQTTFAQLFEFGNALIAEWGFENLDFRSNLGHSIEARRSDRQYIEAGNARLLESATLFTFEPHVRERGGTWGFKHEEIYFFENGGLCVL